MKRILEIAIGGFLGAVLLWYVAFRIYPPASTSIPQKAISTQSLDSQGSPTFTSPTPNSIGSPTKISEQDKKGKINNNEFIIWPNINNKVNKQESSSILVHNDKSILINKKGTLWIDFTVPKNAENNRVEIWIYYSYEPVTIKYNIPHGIGWETDGSFSTFDLRRDGLTKLEVYLRKDHHRKGDLNYIRLHSAFTRVTIQKIILY